jgi:glycoside/pentoside/hexuronide:cation symporter, GPH family
MTTGAHVPGDERPLPATLKAGWATGAFGVAILMNGISALALFYFVSVLRMIRRSPAC